MKPSDRIPVMARPMRGPCYLPCFPRRGFRWQEIQLMPFPIPKDVSMLIQTPITRREIEPFDMLRPRRLADLSIEMFTMPPKHPEM
jgi:hypothetical protein